MECENDVPGSAWIARHNDQVMGWAMMILCGMIQFNALYDNKEGSG